MQNIQKKHKYFEAQREDEEILIIARRHWIVYIPSLVIGFFVLISCLALLANLPRIEALDSYVLQAVATVLLSLACLFTLLFVYISWLVNYLNFQIVTREHIVDINQQALFHRKVSELFLNEIQDVSASQKGILQSLLTYGDVTIQTAGELPNFLFEKVNDPYQISKRIMEIKGQYSESLKKRGHTNLGKSL